MLLTGFTGGEASVDQEETDTLAGYSFSYLDSMAIQLEPGSGRPYLYSDESPAFFYGSTRTAAEDGWMGFHWGELKLWNDFILVVEDEMLDRNRATVDVRPYAVSFKWESGDVLTIRPLGSNYNDLLFSFSTPRKFVDFNFFLVCPANAMAPTSKKKQLTNYLPIAIPAATGDTVGIAIGMEDRFLVEQLKPKKQSQKSVKERLWSGKSIWGFHSVGKQFEWVVTYGANPVIMQNRIKDVFDNYSQRVDERKEWALAEINRAYFRCSKVEVNKALNWTKVSLAGLFFRDALSTLLWAGLPWFNDCWGRDTFISLPGASLATGKYEKARELLERFAYWQQTDSTLVSWGKIPNRVRSNDVNFHTVDGTPWFVREVYEYGLYSGDVDLWRRFLEPDSGAIWNANEGTLRYRVDDLGFLTHDDSETWMDAAGPGGAWSPRGNRAVEAQVLWFEQLDVSLRMADFLDDCPVPDSILEKWREARDRVKDRFSEYYIRPDGLGLYDHLDPDGSPDLKIRPNQLFALSVPHSQLFSDTLQPVISERILDTVWRNTVYPWGVASLAPSDPDFHPYHQTTEYPKDAAYHMGIIWTWLSGPFKTGCRLIAHSETSSGQKQATEILRQAGWPIAESEIDQILNWGVPGTLSENLDAIPREGDRPRVSGTVSQTWSLAEFIRTWYQDFLGIDLDIVDDGITVMIEPQIPLEWGDFDCMVPVGEAIVTLKRRDVQLVITTDDAKGMLNFVLILGGSTVRTWKGADEERILLTSSSSQQNEIPTPVISDSVIVFPAKLVTIDGSMAKPVLEPVLPENLKSLQPPPYPMLTGEQVKKWNPNALPVLDLSDPAGDDDGGSGYGYPAAPQFREGILDLTGFRLLEDHQNYYFELTFRSLVDPGWHPEYGFQLTCAAIAIHSPEDDTVSREIGRNSGWRLTQKQAAGRFIFVGGGVEVTDARGEILVKHIPSNIRFSLGSVEDATITFSLPRKYFNGDPSSWTLAILVGSQDDHGGAGIGEFRTVSEQGGIWEGSGGGDGKPNVYDWLIYPPE